MKRKVLISVLTVALVLTLCIGLFVACDKTPEEPATQYKVTFSLGDYDGTDAEPPAEKTVDAGSKIQLPAVGVTWADHTFLGWQLNGEGETLAANAEVTVNSDLNYIAKWQEDTEPLPKVTIYYTLGTELKNVVKDVMTTENEGKYMLNEPRNYIPDAEQEDFLAQLGKAEKYNYYYYDAAATDHKGQAFDYKEFEAEADFAIIIIKESIGTLATSIDSSWYGVYTGESSFGQPYRLTISEEAGGKIELDDSMQGAIGYIPAENIYNTADGKLILAKYDDWSESYVYYYFTKNADGTITMESDEATIQLTKAQEIAVTVYYPIDAQGTLHTIEITAYKTGETCSLDDTPEDAIDADWDAFEAQGGYDKEMHYYFYNDQQKGDEFDWREFEADGDISIIIEFAKFADKLSSIDEKYNGTFRGTSEYWEDTFVLTVSSEDGTATLEYADENNSFFNFEASIEDGSILTKDGKLVFAKGNKLYPTYFYLSEKDGAYTLDSNDEKGVALAKDPTFGDILGGYKSASGSYIYASNKLKDDTYLGSFLYGGELMPVLSFAAATEGSYTLTALHSDTTTFTATYKAADKSITIGTDAYTLDEEAPTASITDFVGYWERSDTNQYWDIQRFSISYGTTEPKSADFEIVGDYLYLFYNPTGSATYYYLLQLHTEGDVKTLVGTYVAPETAPKQVTFNATEKYEAPVVYTEYATEKPITITSNDKAKTLTVSKIEIGAFDVAAKTLANNLKIYVNIDSKDEVWEFTEIGAGSGKMFSYSSFEKDGILLAWTATYDKDGSTFKFVFGIKDEEAETIYLYDYNSNEELGGLTLDGKGVEPGGSEGPGPEEPDLPEIPEGAVTYVGEATTESGYTITKVIIDPTQNVTSAIVTYTKDGKEETKEFTIAPPSYGDGYWEGEYAGHDIKFYYAYTASDPNFNIVIYDDGTCMIGDGDDGYLATFKDENAGKATYVGEATTESGYTITKVVIDTTQQVTTATVTYTKDGNEETKEFTIAPPSYGDGYWEGEYAGHEIKFYYAYTASDPNFNIVIYDDGTCMIGDGDDGYLATFQREGGEQEEPKMLSGEYALQGGSHRMAFEEDGTFTFYFNGTSAYHGTYSSTGANTYYATDSDNDTFKITLNPDGTLTVDCNLSSYDGTYAPYVAPDWAEYKGDVTLTRGENSARLVYIKLNRNDLLNSITFKLYGDDKEYTASASDAADAGFEGYLAYFKLDDGSLSGSLPPYPTAVIKYGATQDELIIANPYSPKDDEPEQMELKEVGTLSTTGTIPIPPAEEVSVWVMTDENGQSSYMKELKVSKGTHKISEIIELLGDDLPTGKNKFWYFANRFKVGNASTGETKYSSDDLDCSASSTMLFAIFSDMTWYVGVTDRDTYPQLYFAHLGTTTGTGTFYKNYNDDYNGRGTDFNYEYDTTDYSITITLDGGQSFKGTFGETTFNSFHYAVINITLTIGEQEYTFGTGSPSEEQEQTPLSGEFELPELTQPFIQEGHTLSFDEWEFTLDGTLTGTYSQKDSETYEGTVTDADETLHTLQFTVTFDEDGTATSIYVYDDNNTYTGDYTAKSATGGGIKITLKHGDHGTGDDVVLDAQAGVAQSIENSAYGRDDYFTAESDVWWWQAWIVNDNPDDIWNPSTYYGEGPRAFDADTTLTAYWSDLWFVNDTNYDVELDIYLSHTGVDYTGKLVSEYNEIDEEITYHLDSDAGTIKITIGEDTFDGTYSFTYSEDWESWELVITIEIQYKGKTYTFEPSAY